MVDDGALAAGSTDDREIDDLNSVVIRPTPFGAMARAAASPAALALAALVISAVTMLNMAAATDIADAKLFSSGGVNAVRQIRWEVSIRLVIAGVALLTAAVAGVRHSRDLPATRYTFSDDGEVADESSEGADAPHWLTLLVGASLIVSLLAVVLYVVALALTLHLHESPNFGLPGG